MTVSLRVLGEIPMPAGFFLWLYIKFDVNMESYDFDMIKNLCERCVVMEYKGKYKEMAEQFRKDGCDEYLVEKFIRQQMEEDEFAKGEGTTDLEAVRLWKTYPEEAKDMWLHNAFCANCGVASFKPGYSLRKDKLLR